MRFNLAFDISSSFKSESVQILYADKSSRRAGVVVHIRNYLRVLIRPIPHRPQTYLSLVHLTDRFCVDSQYIQLASYGRYLLLQQDA